MPLQPWMKLISVDDHLIEHPRVWQDRLPAALKETGPRIVEQSLGEGRPPAQVWVYENRIYPYIGLNAVAGKKPEEYGLDPVRYDDMIPGCYDPKARLADMDIDGVEAMMCFPSFPRFCGTVFLEAEDKDLALLCVQAYNDFVLDEWCAAGPGRLIPIVLLPLWDVTEAVKEIHRTAGKGAKGISFPDLPHALGLPSVHSDYWDPVFSAAEETGMPLCQHFGSGGATSIPQIAPDAPFAVMTNLMGTNSMHATTDWVFSGALHKHPNLKIGLSEGGIGWIPYIIERADYVWRKHRFYQNINQDVKPSEIFAKHFHGCFIEDDFGLSNRERVGIDRITWECDYPHSDSFWPASRKRAEEAFQDVPDEEVHKIVELNARRLYNLPVADPVPAGQSS
ncbi:amidohydrolase family protein [Nocardia jinanensis]|uniref:Amidohydrolase n=1 Tax=Nocardia jinanensis TaxID=382504 RepID=A0A917RLQ0_9NOCA|nr:amidohydrolase family protein [Nocardia jinanensis]GGL13798.1 amidohydrolase [Nocardia jinanensis]